jgi:hypothetical protein
MSYYGGRKGKLEVSTMPFSYLMNARRKLGKKLEAGEDAGDNNADTLAELDAELDRRRAEMPAPATSAVEAAPPPAAPDDDEVTW